MTTTTTTTQPTAALLAAANEASGRRCRVIEGHDYKALLKGAGFRRERAHNALSRSYYETWTRGQDIIEVRDADHCNICYWAFGKQCGTKTSAIPAGGHCLRLSINGRGAKTRLIWELTVGAFASAE